MTYTIPATIWKSGNSHVITIPPNILNALSKKDGDTIIVEIQDESVQDESQ